MCPGDEKNIVSGYSLWVCVTAVGFNSHMSWMSHCSENTRITEGTQPKLIPPVFAELLFHIFRKAVMWAANPRSDSGEVGGVSRVNELKSCGAVSEWCHRWLKEVKENRLRFTFASLLVFPPHL